MADCISDQNIVELTAPKMIIEYVKMLDGILQMISIPTSAIAHSVTASARAEEATRGFNIRAGQLSLVAEAAECGTI